MLKIDYTNQKKKNQPNKQTNKQKTQRTRKNKQNKQTNKQIHE